MNQKTDDTNKYVIYARKSSEDDTRQIQSIGDQINELKSLSSKEDLNVVKEFKETKSAKSPDTREVFQEMLSFIEKGKADSILCWDITRLSRNPVDGGRIQWMLQKGTIKSIKTPLREFLPQDNAILLSIENGMANQYLLELSRNTRRGMKSKVEKGWYPSRAPQGYINNRIDKTIDVDPDRFQLIRKAWKLMLTGNYSGTEILNIINDKWGYSTRKTSRMGGNQLSRSDIYRIFGDVFYTGQFLWNGEVYQGKHEAMITVKEFEKVQKILGKPGRPQLKTHDHAYTGLIRCMECGCYYTAETKTKYIKSIKEYRSYTYYKCTRRKKHIKCNNRQSIGVIELENQFDRFIREHTIKPEFRKIAIEKIKEEFEGDIDFKESLIKSQKDEISSINKELENLLDIRLKDLIDDNVYKKKKTKLTRRLKKLEDELSESEGETTKVLEIFEDTVNLLTWGSYYFISASKKERRAIMKALGKNFVAKDGIVYMEPQDWIAPVEEIYSELELESKRLEPVFFPVNSVNNAHFVGVFSSWGA